MMHAVLIVSVQRVNTYCRDLYTIISRLTHSSVFTPAGPLTSCQYMTPLIRLILL